MPRKRQAKYEANNEELAGQGAEGTATSTLRPPDSEYTTDVITGASVRGTPEEMQSVQVLASRLVQDYDYAPSTIQTHPQYRVRKRPSDETRSYPVDIAVFNSPERSEANLFMIAECKSRARRDGVAQLKLYLDMSPAELGIWFNGEEHVYLRKVIHEDGRRTYVELPNIPRSGQRIEDIGRFLRKDLRKPSNLKSIFRDLRNHLAGSVTGITRDEALAQEIINVLFCKIYDEVNTAPDSLVTFRIGHGESPKVLHTRLRDLFEKVKAEYDDVFSPSDAIRLDSQSLVYVVGELQNYAITQADRDAIGDAFEVFIGPALRGAEGQFFTPRNVVQMVVAMLNPGPGEMILDPACGSGGFLITALDHVWNQIAREAAKLHWDPVQFDRRKRENATKCFRGIDKDTFLAKVSKAYMAIMGDGRGGIFCENTLLPPEEWHTETSSSIKLRTFDVVITNPPFGSKIPIKGERTLRQYDLAFKWTFDRKNSSHTKSEGLRPDQAPQILFLERCLQFLKPGGRMGIVLPESVLGNPTYRYVMQWLMSNVTITAVITMPESLFKTSGKGGTHTKVCILLLQNNLPSEDWDIFMADAKWCGHDSRGNPTIRVDENGNGTILDDVPAIAERFLQITRGDTATQDHLGFILRRSDVSNDILVPKYYDPELTAQLEMLRGSHDLLSIGGLVRDGVLKITSGVELGKMAYGTGPIPFIRTSDISNWELKADPKHSVSQDLYAAVKHKTDVRPHDILLVRDGTYLIGTSAIVTDADTRILFQSHLLKLRVLQPHLLDPWLLFASLNSPIVKRQIRSKQFTQDIIDTIGNRILEVVLPIPKDTRLRTDIASSTKHIVETRAKLRDEARAIGLAIQGVSPLEEKATENP